MRKFFLIPAALLAVAGLAACGHKAKDEAAGANESIGGDSNTMGEAVTDLNAATDAALGNAESSYSGNMTDQTDEGSGDQGSGDAGGNEVDD